MKSKYSQLFSPLNVKNMTIKNRIAMMPMGTNYGEQNGEMSFSAYQLLQAESNGRNGADYRGKCQRRLSVRLQWNHPDPD